MARVLLYSPRYPPYRGGSANYLSNLVHSLSETHDFFVLTARHAEKPLFECDDNGCQIYRVIPRLESLPGILRMSIEFPIAFLFTLFILYSKDIDVSHVHSSSYSSPAIGFATVIHNSDIIYDFRDEGFPRWITNIGNIPYVFSCAPSVDEKLIASGIDESDIIRVPVVNPEYIENYSDSNPDYSASRKPDTSFDIVFVGKILERKGIFLLSDAFKEFNDEYEDTRLTIVGDGQDREEILDKLRSENIMENVSFLGEVDHRNALEQVASADVLVLPSYREGLARVVVEAFEIGTPVIATPVGSIPKLIDDGESGFLIDHSSDELVTALMRLYHDPSLQTDIASRAQKKSEERDWSTVCERVSHSYNNI